MNNDGNGITGSEFSFNEIRDSSRTDGGGTGCAGIRIKGTSTGTIKSTRIMEIYCNNAVGKYIYRDGTVTTNQWTMENSCFDNTKITSKSDTTRWHEPSASFSTPTYPGTKFCDGKSAPTTRNVAAGVTGGDPGSINKVFDYSNPGDTL